MSLICGSLAAASILTWMSQENSPLYNLNCDFENYKGKALRLREEIQVAQLYVARLYWPLRETVIFM